ncbi:MAG TPA: hypothetical protein VKX46_06975 [Ktedonobacteraceae bacterium]|nr:hypothetical protein [Ktedonobacteraceae bacterium]
MRRTFEEICQGQHPWLPLGNFMNDWYASQVDRRADLVADPLPEIYPAEMQRWAAFCAAAGEWFCHRNDVSCPDWPMAPRYILAEPWFFHEREKLRQQLLTTTPDAFRRRNIYCGDRVFRNKYEIPHPIQLVPAQRSTVRETL